MRKESTAKALETVNEAVVEAQQMAASAGLIYVSDTEPGIRRLRKGKRFAYVSPNNRPLTDEAELKRIAGLAIPPAYEDVWICRSPRGHIQATGRDARRRKQYRYHPEWTTVRDSAKFERMIEFGEALPKLRRRLRHDLALKSLPREKVLAVIISLLDATRVRIGNPEYARDNKSFGLTTLRDRHVRFIRDGRAVMQFSGKGGAPHEVVIDDKRLARIVRSCQDLPGQQLFQYVDDEGNRHPVSSEQVNDYLRDVMGSEFTAKDFRTWGATLRAIALMAATPLPEKVSESALKSPITAAIKQVAQELRNTPAICRKSYINPIVFLAWRSGSLHKAIRDNMSAAPRKAETLALAFLRREAKRAEKLAKEPLESVLKRSLRRQGKARRRPQTRRARTPTRAAHQSARP
ncbi:MAG: DNA topoisomerase IB [Burkholderiaceae bacterium]